MLGRPMTFDFDGPPPEPDWLVQGLIERGTITLLSADSGAGKSMVSASIAVAIIQGKPWNGRPTTGGRVLVVDEENFRRVVHNRLRALGMTNAHRANLRYFLRAGVKLGAEDWGERVQEELEAFKPDLLIIDTAAAATSVDMNDNTGVAALFATTLRPLADECAVMLLHHERKPQQGGKRDAGHAMMGARQWAGQADSHLALEKLGEVHVEPLPGGGVRKRYPIGLEMPKNRDGDAAREKLVILSENDPGCPVKWIRVERVGRDAP
jgi:RecA-family ATPase